MHNLNPGANIKAVIFVLYPAARDHFNNCISYQTHFDVEGKFQVILGGFAEIDRAIESLIE